MRHFGGLLALSGSSILFCAASQAATYYVSPTGNDKNWGRLPSSAWRTLQNVTNTVLRPGDSVLFQGGATFNGRIYLDELDRGSLQNPITIGSYGTGRAIINGGDDSGFHAYNTAGIRITNLKFVGSGVENTKDGISFFTDLDGDVKLAGITIDRVEVSGFGSCGITIGSGNGRTGYRDIKITNVSAHNNRHAGICTYAQMPDVHENVYVGQSFAFNNSGHPDAQGNSGSGIVLGSVNKATIERCVAHSNGKYNYVPHEGIIGIWSYDSVYVRMQFNESFANRTGSNTDGGGFDFDHNVRNSVMQYNYSHDNDGSGYLLCSPNNSGNVIRYNISQNDGRKNGYSSIHTYGDIQNAEIYNNTVFITQTMGSPRALFIQSPATSLHVRNNIFYTSGGARLVEIVDGQVGLAVQGNCYFAGNGKFSIVHAGIDYTSLDAWRNGTGQEQLGGRKLGINANPRLTSPGKGQTLNNPYALGNVTAYKLRDTSPLINRGLNLKSLFQLNVGKRDFFGPALPEVRFDIGAHEHTKE